MSAESRSNRSNAELAPHTSEPLAHHRREARREAVSRDSARATASCLLVVARLRRNRRPRIGKRLRAPALARADLRLRRRRAQQQCDGKVHTERQHDAISADCTAEKAAATPPDTDWLTTIDPVGGTHGRAQTTGEKRASFAARRQVWRRGLAAACSCTGAAVVHAGSAARRDGSTCRDRRRCARRPRRRP